MEIANQIKAIQETIYKYSVRNRIPNQVTNNCFIQAVLNHK